MPVRRSIALLNFLLTAILAAHQAAASTLTIRDAIERALERRPEVKRAQAELAKAMLDEPGVLANTDPAFVASGMRSVDESPQTAPQIFGTRTTMDDLRAGFRKRTLIGTEMDLTLGTQRQETLGSLFLPGDPVISSSLDLSVSQGLLKNLWGRPDKARRKMASSGVQAARFRLASAQYLVAADAALAFLDYVAAGRELDLRRQGLADAERFQATTREKMGYGLSEPSDAAQADVNLALRRLELTAAESGLVQTRIRLLTAAGMPADAGEWAVGQPSWDHESDMPQAAEMSVEAALAARPDVGSLQAMVAGAEARLKFQKLMGLPSLTLQGSYGFAGLSGSYSRSLDDTLGLSHPVYTFGLSLNLPLRAAVEKIAVETARTDLASMREELARTELAARHEILAAGENLKLARKRAETAETLVDLQRAKYAAEESNYRQGRSNTETLLRFSEERRGAQRELLSARIGLAKAIYALKLAQGERF